jgi:hypothetical protein
MDEVSPVMGSEWAENLACAFSNREIVLTASLKDC